MYACVREGLWRHEEARGNRGRVGVLMGDFGCCGSEACGDGGGWNEILELI